MVGARMRVTLLRVIALAIAITAAACLWGQSAPRTPVTPQEEPKELGPVTAPTREKAAEAVKEKVGPQAVATAAPVDPKTYEIGPEDILLVRVWREAELTGGHQVRPDGKITMPLIGEVQAAGLTPEALKTSITEALSEFINKPEVIVSVQSVQSRRYYITGEVNRPGAFPLVVPITILEALTNAGGFREFANLKNIKILRKGKVLKFNFKDVSNGKNMQQNILVENGDYIVVN
jgi:polysaccharide export outer membrane protein